MFTNWFRPVNGKFLHLEIDRERDVFGLPKIKTACGKSFFEGDKYLRGEKKHCVKCEAANDSAASVDWEINLSKITEKAMKY
jgi:hypothetical protein